MTFRLIYLLATVVLIAFAPMSSAEQARFEAAESRGVQATRDDRSVHLRIDDKLADAVTIPRLAAPLRSMRWQGRDNDDGLSLKPGLETWVISWKNRPAGASTLILTFDAEPLLPSEVEPIEATGDGSFYLPAHLAVTQGERIRYEPQTTKNTVGYWAGKEDNATWSFKLDKPGRFNVAILQGCGKGRGGSAATVSFFSPVKDITASVDFEVVETGHFQNFQWVHLGEVELMHAGEVSVNVKPQDIKKGALMDLRAVHLIRLPDKK